MSAAGKFVWRTLMTPDAAKAEAFYREVAGWSIKAEKMGDDEYRVCAAGDNPTADIVEAPDPSIPPHWMAYLAVDDLDATIEKAQSLGATVMMGATEIPTVGRFAVLQDPQGAVFWPFEGSGDSEGPSLEVGAQHGNWGWTEIMTSDIGSASQFYSKVIGWEPVAQDMPSGAYTLFSHGGTQRAGGMNIPPGVEMPPSWTSYLTVDDAEAALERVRAAGGQVLTELMDIPQVGKICPVMDPTGAAFCIAEWSMPASDEEG